MKDTEVYDTRIRKAYELLASTLDEYSEGAINTTNDFVVHNYVVKSDISWVVTFYSDTNLLADEVEIEFFETDVDDYYVKLYKNVYTRLFTEQKEQ